MRQKKKKKRNLAYRKIRWIGKGNELRVQTSRCAMEKAWKLWSYQGAYISSNSSFAILAFPGAWFAIL